ncbi:MAG: dihydrouridine synthase DuS [Spirochaetes bacterium]|nr:MAG: dihydrouridine synthase DuS [Spirochaetota bacterium]
MPLFEPGSTLLAPMVGITNRAFRTLVAELGEPDFLFTEMASAEAFVARAQYEEDYTDPRPLNSKTSIQFFARSEDALSKACELVARRLAQARPAGIDINFGCSAPHIRRSGGGSAWSADPLGAARLVGAARSAWPGLLSAKVRMGGDDDYARIHAFCQALASKGLDFLTFHPRTDDQKFRRKARHDLSQRLSLDLGIPLVANGDIKSPIHSLMIGRQAIRSPWIFVREPLPPQGFDRLAIGIRFLELVDTLLPLPWKKESCRRFFSYYCDELTFAHHIKYRLVNAPDIPTMEKELSRYFNEVPHDRTAFPKAEK